MCTSLQQWQNFHLLKDKYSVGRRKKLLKYFLGIVINLSEGRACPKLLEEAILQALEESGPRLNQPGNNT